jgi:cytochrome P450 family 6
MIFTILIGAVLALVFALNKYYFSYWEKLGFKQLKSPKFLVGHAGPLFTKKASMGVLFSELYHEYKNVRVLGVYMTYLPSLIITDPKLVQDIMIRDFTSFHDRPMPCDEKNDPLTSHLFNLPGQKWRDLRVKLSPTFTSGKLKSMFPIIRDCGKVLEDYLVKNVKNGVDVFEFRDLMARFNTNIISSVAFGIENDCINEPDHIFRRMGLKFFEKTFKNSMRGLLTFLCHKHFHKLPIKAIDQEVEDFIFSIVNQTIDHREKTNFKRSDFMQLLIQLKNDGFVSADKNDKNEGEEAPVDAQKLSLNLLAANVFVFFVAGESMRNSSGTETNRTENRFRDDQHHFVLLSVRDRQKT